MNNYLLWAIYFFECVITILLCKINDKLDKK